MMLRTTSGSGLAAIVALATLLPATSGQCDATTDRASIGALYSAYSRAMKARDIPTLLGMESPDYTAVLSSGKTLDRKTADGQFAQQLAAARSIDSCEIAVETISVSGAQATAVVTQAIKATVLDNHGGKHDVRSKTQSRDTWTRTSHGWFLKRSVDLSEHTTVDGKAA
jgi:ketosteroid isomerase-like protein